MSEKDLSQRRRAIATGLQDFMDETAVERALRHWESRYADQPSLALQRFVADICNDGALKSQRAAVLRSLLSTMNLPENQLASTPGARPMPSSQRQATLSHSTAFSELMLALMNQLGESQQAKLRLDLFAALRRRNLPPSILDALQRWLASRQPLDLDNASAVLLQKLINQYYVLLCESMGPIQADKMLAHAVQKVQRDRPELDTFLGALL